MKSHDLRSTKTRILGATPGAILGIDGNPHERFSFAPALSERFFENWGGPRAPERLHLHPQIMKSYSPSPRRLTSLPQVVTMFLMMMMIIMMMMTNKEGKSAINLSNLGNFCQIWPRVVYLCWAGRRSRKLLMLGRLAVPKTLQILGKILT